MPSVREGGVAMKPTDAEMVAVRQPTSSYVTQLDAPVAISNVAPTLKAAESAVTVAPMLMVVRRKKLRLGTAARDPSSERWQAAVAEKDEVVGILKRKERPCRTHVGVGCGCSADGLPTLGAVRSARCEVRGTVRVPLRFGCVSKLMPSSLMMR